MYTHGEVERERDRLGSNLALIYTPTTTTTVTPIMNCDSSVSLGDLQLSSVFPSFILTYSCESDLRHFHAQSFQVLSPCVCVWHVRWGKGHGPFAANTLQIHRLGATIRPIIPHPRGLSSLSLSPLQPLHRTPGPSLFLILDLV